MIWETTGLYAVAIASLLHHWWPLADRFHPVDRFALLILPSLAFRVAWAWTHRPPRRIDGPLVARVLQ